METNQNESVAQSEVSGATTESVKTETLSKADSDFKRDMLKYKDENSDLRDRLKDIDLEKQTRKGDFEGVISTLKDEVKNLKGKLATKDYSYANTQIDSALEKEALERGVTGNKLEILMKLIDENDKGAVSLDDRYIVDKEDVKGLVDKHMDRYSDIFTKRVKISDGVPSNIMPAQTKEKSTDNMNSSELREYVLRNKNRLK